MDIRDTIQTPRHRVIDTLNRRLRAAIIYLEPYEIVTLFGMLTYGWVLWWTGQRLSKEIFFIIGAYSLAFFLMVALVSLSVQIIERMRGRANGAITTVWQLPGMSFYARLFFVFICSYFTYYHLAILTSLIHFEDKDNVLRSIEQWLFLGHDLTILLQSLVWPPLTEYFRLVYSLHIFLFFATPMLLCLQNRRRELNNLIFSLVLTLYLGFVGYTLVPAVGPYVYPPLRDAYTVSLDGSELAQAQANFIDTQSYPRSVFPSLHTAVSSVILVYVFRYNRELRWFFLVLVVSIWCSTLYLRYHYVPDLFAGWLLTWLVCWLAPAINARWNHWRDSLQTLS